MRRRAIFTRFETIKLITMKKPIAIVLAAGKGTRMKSEVPKVLHKVLGRPIISYILDSLRSAGLEKIITIAGYGSDLVKKAIQGTTVIKQKRLLGSGDAVNSARRILKDYSGEVLIICGDTPLLKSGSIKALMQKHYSSGAVLTLLTTSLKNPTGYGRIIRDGTGKIIKIVEETEASLYEEVIEEVNVGMYCCKSEALFQALSKIAPNNKKKEYFITDIIEIFRNRGLAIESVTAEDPDEIIGINTRKDMAQAAGILKRRVMEELMLSGVTIEDPSSTMIYPGAKIGSDTVIYPNTLIESDVVIGRRCHIGPFARIRPDVIVEDDAEIGNFVELIRAKVGARTKVKHHTYLGDATVGKDVNIGAGTITANYDGKNKNRTVIESGAFIGVGAILIAPVTIGKWSVVGAGCVVPRNHNVKAYSTVVGVPARILKKRG